MLETFFAVFLGTLLAHFFLWLAGSLLPVNGIEKKTVPTPVKSAAVKEEKKTEQTREEAFEMMMDYDLSTAYVRGSLDEKE